MSTVSNMIGAGLTGTNGVGDSALNNLSSKLAEIEENDNYSDEYKQKEVDRLSGQIGAVSAQLTASYNSANIVTSMLGISNDDASDLSMFFGSDLTSIKALYNATLSVQKEARTLAAEVRLDKIRGVDTSDKEAKLANLNDSVSFLDKTVSSKIDNALSDKSLDMDSRSVIDQIKDDLKANQKKLDKEFGNAEDDEEEKKTEAADSSDKSSKTEKKKDNRSVIDRINDELAENQKKLDEEFSGKA
ncbi:MAG: hypothetical protein J1F60_01875 [Oscillospiraceae bacterium]|nr:hypothetical protein [Oscillospiraceae bacterium]